MEYMQQTFTNWPKLEDFQRVQTIYSICEKFTTLANSKGDELAKRKLLPISLTKFLTLFGYQNDSVLNNFTLTVNLYIPTRWEKTPNRKHKICKPVSNFLAYFQEK